jgi:uncharacterized protein with FMN-binding domain
MSNKQPKRDSGLGRMLRKSFVSVFVLSTYVAYVLHERFITPAGDPSALAPTPDVTAVQSDTAQQGAAQQDTASQASAQSAAQPTPQPAPAKPRATPAPSATAITANVSQGQYKNGTYTGPTVNAFYGLVQVKVSIQNGKITNVQFVQYPNDRRTSVRINSVAVPYLQSEALQAQSANVDIISGATLTSEAFMESLQSALDNAKG